MRILHSYKREALSLICHSAYGCAHPSATPEKLDIPPEISFSELIFSELLIGSPNDKNFWIDIDIIKCQTKKFETFHITEGKRINSVYCVKPTRLGPKKQNEFQLDDRFQDDIELQYKFTDEAESIIANMVRRSHYR